ADGQLRTELARIARMLGNERERAKVLEKALTAVGELGSLQSELLLELAQLWDENVGDVDEAESAYTRLIAVDPEDAETVLGASRALERIHLGKGDHAQLAEDLRRQVRLDDDVDEKRRLLGRLADLLGEIRHDPGAASSIRATSMRCARSSGSTSRRASGRSSSTCSRRATPRSPTRTSRRPSPAASARSTRRSSPTRRTRSSPTTICSRASGRTTR